MIKWLSKKHDRNRQLVWLGIYTGIGLAIVFLLPFPVDLILLIGTMVGMNFIRRRWLMGKYLGGKSIGGLFGSFPSSSSGIIALEYIILHLLIEKDTKVHCGED
jgi:hypothetical protein